MREQEIIAKKKLQKKKESLLSDFLQELCINGIDGVTILFFITTGLMFAGISNNNILVIGIVSGILISMTMAISTYISRNAEKKHFQSLGNKGTLDAEDFKEKRLLENLGIGNHVQWLAQEEIEKDRKLWQNLLVKLDEDQDMNWTKPAFRSAAITAVSYVSGCIIPLIPYICTNDNQTGLLYSGILSLVTLFILGYYKSKSLKTPLLGGAFASLFMGVLAGIGGYLIARIFVQMI